MRVRAPVFYARIPLAGVLRRTHQCQRCGADIRPGDVYSAVDVLDAEGRIRTLLCRSCGAGLRAFVSGEAGDGGGNGDGDGDGDGSGGIGGSDDGDGETDHERDTSDHADGECRD
jgi:hypothetical protein